MSSDAVNSLGESWRRHRFQEIIEGAGLERVNRVLIEGRDKNNDRQRTRHETFHDSEAIDPRHLDIEQEQVGTELLHGLKSGCPIRALAYGLNPALLAQHAPEPAPGEWFVVNDECANFYHQERKGIVTSTVTPFPSVSVTLASSPNNSCNRARVFASPIPSRAGGAS